MDCLYKQSDVVAFTGTQQGMTESQKKQFSNLIIELKPKVFIHGDCIGSDSEAHDITKDLIDKVILCTRPCTISKKRAFKRAFLLSEPKLPLERNREIINDCTCLVATPKEEYEELRSGTWATIRYARKQNKTIYILWPNGEIKIED